MIRFRVLKKHIMTMKGKNKMTVKCYDVRMFEGDVWCIISDDFATIKEAKNAVKEYKKEDKENGDNGIEYKIFVNVEFEVK